jgi:hypothetical protein
MKYQIRETAVYTVEADSAQEALDVFLGPKGITSPFPVVVDEREVYDEKGNWCETNEVEISPIGKQCFPGILHAQDKKGNCLICETKEA